MKERIRYSWARNKWDPTMAELERELGLAGLPGLTNTIRQWMKDADPEFMSAPAPVVADNAYNNALAMANVGMQQMSLAQMAGMQNAASNFNLYAQQQAVIYSSHPVLSLTIAQLLGLR